MRLVSEHVEGVVRARTLACDECATEAECDTRFLAFQAHRDDLWVCLAWCADGGDDADDQAAGELAKIFDVIGDELPEVVDRYTALVGMTWPLLVRNGEACRDQLIVCNRTPDWMLRLDPEMVWATRGCVFGHDLTRVHRALWAMHRYYEPDAPAVERWSS
jgi:hypothetical protein